MNTLRAAKLMRRLMLPVAGLVVLWVYLTVGLLRVPVGMDTLTETHPEGSLCVIDKRSGSIHQGAVVFVDALGGTLLSRVSSRADGFIRLRHDNRGSAFPDGEELGPLPIAAVRGVVLAVFPPKTDLPDLPHGR